MTLVGKIFTMLILIMSIVFLAFSVMVFATHRNWKQYADNASPGPGQKLGLKQQYENLQAQKREADTQLEQLKTQLAQEQAARKQALASLQVRANQADQALGALQNQFNELSAQHTNATEAAKTAQTRLEMLESENAGLRSKLIAVERDLDRKFLDVVALTDKLNQAESQRQILEERNTEAASQIAQMKTVLDANGLTADALVSHIPPRVEGVVTEVSGSDLVEISIGADDGLREGHPLHVYRGNTYLGEIEIRRTNPDRAVGKIKKEMQRGQIKRGDRVTSKFS
jgi:multidrug efflux pump subunit AcrA (membrane-fusion protein)